MKLAWDRRAARRLTIALSAGTGLLLAGCSPSGSGAGSPAAGSAPPPPEVGVLTVAPGHADLAAELPGRLEAYRVAQVRARAAGILQKRLFAEGADVKAGQALFEIDPAPYRAALASAQAQLARAEANLLQAQALADRYAPLAKTQAVSPQEALNAQAAAQQARADVAAGQAAVQTAQINLGYAHVTAPIAGRIGRALVTEGALVGQGEATPRARELREVGVTSVYFFARKARPQSDMRVLRELVGEGLELFYYNALQGHSYYPRWESDDPAPFVTTDLSGKEIGWDIHDERFRTRADHYLDLWEEVSTLPGLRGVQVFEENRDGNMRSPSLQSEMRAAGVRGD
ncbi:MAG: efflux RND transporter periplasmic adaptor subunit, partial [Proteobacteria bacterium]|nr:efflux RND transporter periplasmic adaptor subunit [Pseudomonadota bacterium]